MKCINLKTYWFRYILKIKFDNYAKTFTFFI